VTFSLAARCSRSNQFGVVVASSSPAVAARCAWARAGVGAVVTQNVTDPRLGAALLDAIADGLTALEAMDAVVAKAPLAEYRQLAAVDSAGCAAVYSGEHTLGRHASATCANAVAAGNLLGSPDVPAAMLAAFGQTAGEDLGDRLLTALLAGETAGGEEGPVHSAGLVIVDQVPWPATDLRVDWSEDPLGGLQDLWRVWKPQVTDYLTRALDPRLAPVYGVPGDERPPQL
jgi:uncharacterized Ntn-hydrolase superfamily protein